MCVSRRVRYGDELPRLHDSLVKWKPLIRCRGGRGCQISGRDETGEEEGLVQG